MGELTYKAKDLGNNIIGAVKPSTGRTSNGWRLQGETVSQDRKSGRRTFLGKVTGYVGS
ncbi:hypothetical protein [Sphingorhabdus sp.]|uniref:hypothetical protein n=1 Tax=Sphingorhabdus sp. TaxID=1902408 RepID=UPI00391A5F58